MRIANPLAIKGEQIAAEYLQKHGYKILERNYSKRYGEIDIIALEGKVLVFVEVKTRMSHAYGTPLEAITPWKLRSVTQTAEYYVVTHPNLPQQLRIDAVGIIMDTKGNAVEIEHSKNISGF